jgi:hypothetical protein
VICYLALLPTPTPVPLSTGGSTEWTVWVPAISALISLGALVTSIVLASTQRLGDNRISANSVLIWLSEDKSKIRLKNDGKYPILDVQIYVGKQLVESVEEQTPLASGEARDFEFKHDGSDVGLARSFPHGIRVTFADARGRYWSRTPLKLAERI